MVNTNQIKADTPVMCSNNVQFGIVDHMEGRDTIKLQKDKQGQHHYIPLSWVTTVDDKVHIDRPGAQAMKEWSRSPSPKGALGSDTPRFKEPSASSKGNEHANLHSTP